MPTTNTDELIVYSNSSNGLGIRILGAKRATNRSGIYIKQLLADGLAKRDGRLKVGDQILSINDEITIGINRKHAVNILRSAAATNQVRLHVRHFPPSLSSNEYQKLLFDEKLSDEDDDDEDIHRILNYSQNKNYNTNSTITNEVQMRRSSRRYHQEQEQQQQYRHSTRFSPFYNRKDQEEKNHNDRILKGLDISHNALQSLLNSKFKLIDLVDLLKRIYPNLLFNDHKRELQFIQHLSQTNTDGRITLKDFERQSSVLLGGHINLLSPFYSSSTRSSTENDNQIIVELRREIDLCRSTIDELQNKIITCEKSQLLSEEVENEYEDLLKYVYEQIRQYKLNERNQFKQIQANDQLIQKLFNYLSSFINKPNDEYILSQLKYQYEQQQKFSSVTYEQNSNSNSILSNKKSHQQI